MPHANPRNERTVRNPNLCREKARSEGCCRRCGATERVTAHHVFPKQLGGNDVEENIVPVCRACHHIEFKEGWVKLAGELFPHMTPGERRHLLDSLRLVVSQEAAKPLAKGRDS